MLKKLIFNVAIHFLFIKQTYNEIFYLFTQYFINFMRYATSGGNAA